MGIVARLEAREKRANERMMQYISNARGGFELINNFPIPEEAAIFINCYFKKFPSGEIGNLLQDLKRDDKDRIYPLVSPDHIAKLINVFFNRGLEEYSKSEVATAFSLKLYYFSTVSLIEAFISYRNLFMLSTKHVHALSVTQCIFNCFDDERRKGIFLGIFEQCQKFIKNNDVESLESYLWLAKHLSHLNENFYVNRSLN